MAGDQDAGHSGRPLRSLLVALADVQLPPGCVPGHKQVSVQRTRRISCGAIRHMELSLTALFLLFLVLPAFLMLARIVFDWFGTASFCPPDIDTSTSSSSAVIG